MKKENVILAARALDLLNFTPSNGKPRRGLCTLTVTVAFAKVKLAIYLLREFGQGN